MTIPHPSPVKTVDKFGISARGSTGNGPMLAIKTKQKFRVIFLGFGGAGGTAEPITLNVNTCSLPTLDTTEVTVHSYNSQAYFAGKSAWSDVTLSVRDSVDNTVTKTIGKQVQLQMDHYNQTGYRAAQDYKFTTIIQYLNGGHDTANASWTLEGCFLKNVNYGEVDYSSSEVINISMTLRYDNAILEDLSGVNSIFGAVPADPLGNFINS